MAKPDPSLLAAMGACAAHGRSLFESAKAVQASGHPNIAYHLATLALEELGKGELLKLQATAVTRSDPPLWPAKATQDHVKKLFWCFYGLCGIDRIADQEHFFQMRDTAADMHAKRLAGLYVDEVDQVLRVPSEAVSHEQAQRQINLAEAFLNIVESQQLSEDIPQENIELRIWLMDSFDDPERRKQILTQASLEKLKELSDVAAWTRWIKEEIERNDAEMRAMMEREIQRGNEATKEVDNDKWKVQFRIETQYHSIRSNVLKIWNDSMPWIKLLTVHGARSKKELLVQLTLREHVPLQGLWDYSFGIANHLIVALNIATSGLWWWVLSRHKTRFFDKIQGLENKCEVGLDRMDTQVFTGPPPAINEVNMNVLKACFVALPHPTEQDRAPAYNFYFGGLMFLSLSDVHWRCEGQAFGNFLQSLKLMVVETRYAQPSEKPSGTIGRLLKV